MVIGFFADIHANLEALTACLDHARERNVERRVFLGDHVGYGADPVPVLEMIMGFVGGGDVAVLGNHDVAVAERSRTPMNLIARKVVEWTRSQLSAPQIEFLGGLPLTVEEDGRLYVHANAWDPRCWEYIHGTAEADRSLRATECGQTFCGHVHQPALYHRSQAWKVSGFLPVPGTGIPLGPARRWLVLPGSVGQPRDGIPAACYASLDDATNVLTYFRVPYDVDTAARKVREAGLPESLGLRLEVGY